MIGALSSTIPANSLAARQVDLNTLTRPTPPAGLNARLSGLTDQQNEFAAKQAEKQGEAKELFNHWVGMTFYGQLISEMRKGMQQNPYFHGGRAEEVFQGQLDMQMAEHMADASGESFSGPMYELSMLQRK